MKPAAKVVASAPAKASNSTVSLLDPKRANNISIILSRIKLSFDQIRTAVLELDAEVGVGSCSHGSYTHGSSAHAPSLPVERLPARVTTRLPSSEALPLVALRPCRSTR